uniref:TBC1 domain family member 24 n=1 Tax=Panagrolaimus sp. JU765 TaxID=591449 RepID=A0AC34QH23_9BILA
MSSSIFVSRDSEEVFKVLSSSQQHSSNYPVAEKDNSKIKMKAADRLNSIPFSGEFQGLSKFSMSDYYAGTSEDASMEHDENYYSHHGSALTTISTVSSDSTYSSASSEENQTLRRLPRQLAIDLDDAAFKPDRSVSVDSGFTDHSDELASDLKLAKKMAKAWVKRAEFRKKIESSENVTEAVQKKINYVKKFVRNNDWPVSHEIRSDIWKVLCFNKDFDVHKRLYHEQLENLTKSGVKTLTPLFLTFDGIVVHDHGLKELGAVTLQRLLIVVECVRPEIRYVPILYPVCAMFLHYMSPDETFACIMRLLSQGNGFMLQSEVAVYASAHTSLALLKKYKRKVYNLMKQKAGGSHVTDEKLAEIFNNWAAWIFKYLPFPYLVRIMDCFLVEGHKMLLRVVLSLAYVWYKEKGKEHPSQSFNDKTVDEKIESIRDEIIQVVQDCPISISTLLEICTSIRNFKFSTIQRLQNDFEMKYRDKINFERSMKELKSPTRTMYTQAFDSSIIDSEVASELMAALPSRFQLETPVLLFRLSENGVSFTQLWNKTDFAEQTLLIIKATTGEVFGAYCSASWSERNDIRERTRTRYFGTGESFVWHEDRDIGLPIIYKWAGQTSDHPEDCPQMFMTGGDRFLIIGSSGGDAISIRDELTSGLSYPCETFASPALVKGNAFIISEMEVFNCIKQLPDFLKVLVTFQRISLRFVAQKTIPK